MSSLRAGVPGLGPGHEIVDVVYGISSPQLAGLHTVSVGTDDLMRRGGHPASHAGRRDWLSAVLGGPFSGDLAGDDVEPVPSVDERNVQHEGGEGRLVEVLGRHLPHLV